MTATLINWKNKDDKFQQRQFLLSSFVRIKYVITKDVYEFCDFLISQGYVPPLDHLDNVDRDVCERFHQYLREVKGY